MSQYVQTGYVAVDYTPEAYSEDGYVSDGYTAATADDVVTPPAATGRRAGIMFCGTMGLRILRGSE